VFDISTFCSHCTTITDVSIVRALGRARSATSVWLKTPAATEFDHVKQRSAASPFSSDNAFIAVQQNSARLSPQLYELFMDVSATPIRRRLFERISALALIVILFAVEVLWISLLAYLVAGAWLAGLAPFGRRRDWLRSMLAARSSSTSARTTLPSWDPIAPLFYLPRQGALVDPDRLGRLGRLMSLRAGASASAGRPFGLSLP
jgi:hypothetical protein